jgi:hypothetical protein
VDHQAGNCPESERCESCYSRFRTGEMKEYKDNYYCFPCAKEIAHE